MLPIAKREFSSTQAANAYGIFITGVSPLSTSAIPYINVENTERNWHEQNQ